MRYRDNNEAESALREADQNNEKASDESRYEGTPQHASLRDRIEHFTWPWFACTMSTGALAVVLHQTPYQFHGLQVIGKVVFILDLILFLLFTGLTCTRFILVPRKFPHSLHHPVEGLFFGAYWVSIALILNCVQSYGVPSTGAWLVKTLQILFWMYAGIVLLVGIFQYYMLFQKERLRVSDAMPAWIFPIYPLLVIGTLAATIIPSQPHDSAFEIWVGGVMLQGIAWTVALMTYTIYTQRLMSSSMPEPSMRPGMFVSVGPAGYTSAALIALGMEAPKVIPFSAFDVTRKFMGAEVVKILGILSGTFVLLFAFWFFCISIIAVVAGYKEMKFTLNWWAFVFPNAGLTLAAIQLGKAYNSPGINGVCSALTILLIIMWMITAVSHVRAVWKGDIFWPGRDEDHDM